MAVDDAAAAPVVAAGVAAAVVFSGVSSIVGDTILRPELSCPGAAGGSFAVALSGMSGDTRFRSPVVVVPCSGGRAAALSVSTSIGFALLSLERRSLARVLVSVMAVCAVGRCGQQAVAGK